MLAAVLVFFVVACGGGARGDAPSATGPLPASALAGASIATSSAAPAASPLPAEFMVVLEDALGTGLSGRGSIDGFWSRELDGAADPYAPPARIVAYRRGEIPNIACAAGTAADRWRDNAVYCPDDRALAFDADFLHDYWREIGDFAPVTVLAHEWGHHIQTRGTTAGVSLQRELEADCHAGMYVHDLLVRRDDFDRTTALRAIRTMFESGNERYHASEWFAEDEHGSGRVRVDAFGTGMMAFDGKAFCAGYADYRPAEYVEIGPYRLVEPPGMAGRETGQRHILETPYGTAKLAWLPLAPEGRSAEAMLLGVQESVFGERLTPRGDPIAIDPGHLRGDASLGEYDLRNGTGAAATVDHGMMSVFVAPVKTDGVLFIDTWLHGAWPTGEAGSADFEALASLTYVLIQRLCGPGNTTEEGDDLYNAACLEGL